MKERKLSTIIGYVILILLLLIVTILLLISSFKVYVFVSLTALVIISILFYNYINNTKSEDALYNSFVNNIMKTYFSILVEVEEVPSLDNKDIVKVKTFDDLLNAQEEVHKPIFYIKSEDTLTMFIIDSSLACICELKRNSSVESNIDKIIEESDNKQNRLLENLENTAVLKLGNDKIVKVSPVRKKTNNN